MLYEKFGAMARACLFIIDEYRSLLAILHAVVPTALGTALDINLSNASLVFISVTFATMVCPPKDLIHSLFVS